MKSAWSMMMIVVRSVELMEHIDATLKPSWLLLAKDPDFLH